MHDVSNDACEEINTNTRKNQVSWIDFFHLRF